MKLAVTGILILSLMSAAVIGQTNGGATGYTCGVAKCNTCQANICTGCVAGNYLNLNMCKPCPYGCAICNVYGACTNCKEGYGLGSSGSCFTCAEGCASCDAYNPCKVCQSGYEMTTANGRTQCLYQGSGFAAVLFIILIIFCCCCPLFICCVCVFAGKAQAESQGQHYPSNPHGYNQPQGGMQMGGQQPQRPQGYGGYGQQQYY